MSEKLSGAAGGNIAIKSCPVGGATAAEPCRACV
jgi:hypothetical protein